MKAGQGWQLMFGEGGGILPGRLAARLRVLGSDSQAVEPDHGPSSAEIREYIRHHDYQSYIRQQDFTY